MRDETEYNKLQVAYDDAKEREATACRIADGLQGDLEHREIVIGKTLSLLHLLYRQSSWARTMVNVRAFSDAEQNGENRWPDVLRAITTGNVKVELETVVELINSDQPSPAPVMEYRLLLWSFCRNESEVMLCEAGEEGWVYRDCLPDGILLERVRR